MKAAIYCRLSKEDEDKIGESESIQNQKSMLLQYAIEKGFDIYQIYSDEDYSGIDLPQFGNQAAFVIFGVIQFYKAADAEQVCGTHGIRFAVPSVQQNMGR